MNPDKKPLAPALAVPTDQEHQEQEWQPIDFSHCRTIEEVLRIVKVMGSRSEFLPTSDGKMKFSAAQLAQNIDTAVQLAIAATRDPKEPGLTKTVEPDQLDEIFAQHGITSTAGLREAMVRVMHRRGRTGEEFHKLVSEIQQQGEFNPVRKLPLEQFIKEYPRNSVPLEIQEGMSDTDKQAVLRWQAIERANKLNAEQQRDQQLRKWQDSRSRASFRQEWITSPTSADGYAQYTQAQEENRIEREAKEKEAEARPKNLTRIEGPGDKNSISAKIARMMGVEKAAFAYEGINLARGETDLPEPKMTRTFSLPIEGAPGHSITLTLFSEAKVLDKIGSRELPEHFQGVVVESVDQLSVVAGEKAQTADQKRVVELARTQMRQVEAQVRAKYGLDLRIDKKLAGLLL